MLRLVFALSALFSVTAGAAAPDCNQRLTDLLDAKLAIEDRFNVGEGTRTDVAYGDLAYHKALLECGQISVADYCSTAVPAAEIYKNGVKEEFVIGQRTYAEYVGSIDLYHSVKASCP